MQEAIKRFAGSSELVRSQALPRECPAVRLPTYPSIERTSILSLTATSAGTVSAAGTSLVALVRDPCFPVWITYASSTAGWVGGSAPMNTTLPYLVGESLDLTIGTTAESFSPVLSGTPFNGSPYPVIASALGGIWVYVPAGALLAVRFGVSALPDSTLTLAAQQITSFSADDVTNSTMSFTASYAAPYYYFHSTAVTGGWYRPVMLSVAAAGTTSIVVSSIAAVALSGGTMATPIALATGYLYPLLKAPPEFSNSVIPYKSARLNAVSLLLSNTTSVMNKEGTVEALFLRCSGSTFLSSAGSSFSTLAADTATSGRYFGLLEKGLYCYSMPDQSAAEFNPRLSSAVGGSPYPVCVLDSFAYVNLINLVDYGTPATNLAITLDMVLEFRNTTMLWPIGYSTVMLETWHQAQITLMGVGVFFENPTHARQISARSKGKSAGTKQKLLPMGPKAMVVKLSRPQVITRSSSVGSRSSRGSKASRKSKKASRKARKARQR